MNRLRDSDAKSQVIVLITDGGNNAGNIAPEQAAKIAEQYGIKVYTILVGKGGKVPYPVGKNLFNEPAYQMVDIDVNPDLLKEISKTTDGKMYVATDKASLREQLPGHPRPAARRARSSRGRATPSTSELFGAGAGAGLPLRGARACFCRRRS